MEEGDERLRSVLPGRQGRRSLRRALDAACAARIVVRQHAFQRSSPRRATDVTELAQPAIEAARTDWVVERKHGPQGPQYHLTQAGREFAPIVRQLGEWGQRWFRSRYVRDELDVTLLMWDMRRCIEVARSRPAGPACSSIFPICRRRSVPGGWSATARRSIFVPPTRDSRWVSTLRPTCGR